MYGDSALASDSKDVTTFASNEHGLNFLSESEVESKPQMAAEPLPPIENQTPVAPVEDMGFVAQGEGKGWAEQGATGNQRNDSGESMSLVLFLSILNIFILVIFPSNLIEFANYFKEM